MKALRGFSFFILMFCLCSVEATASNFSGYMVGDYYYIISDPKKDNEGENAFRFRRIYLTSDWNKGEKFSSRLRFEARDAGWGKSEKMEPFVKHAYLRWRDIFSGADLYLGLSGTPTWSLSEKIWGYRSVEKTILDLNKIGSSADLGLRVKGTLGGLTYNFMLGNGAGQKSEGDQQKKLYSSFSHSLGKSLNAEIYFDYNEVSENVTERTVKVFIGYSQAESRGGIEAFSRVNGNGNKDETISGTSVFWSQNLNKTGTGFIRWDALWNNGEDMTDHLLIVGYDKKVGPGVHMIPNFRFSDRDSEEKSKVSPYITAYYKF